MNWARQYKFENKPQNMKLENVITPHPSPPKNPNKHLYHRNLFRTIWQYEMEIENSIKYDVRKCNPPTPDKHLHHRNLFHTVWQYKMENENQQDMK